MQFMQPRVRNEIFKLSPDIHTIWLMHLFWPNSLFLCLPLSPFFLPLKMHPKYEPLFSASPLRKIYIRFCTGILFNLKAPLRNRTSDRQWNTLWKEIGSMSVYIVLLYYYIYNLTSYNHILSLNIFYILSETSLFFHRIKF